MVTPKKKQPEKSRKPAKAGKAASERKIKTKAEQEPKSDTPVEPSAKEDKPAATPETEPLTEKEEIFVAEYLKDMNATQAYMRSFSGVKTYGTAAVCACQLLKKPNVRARVDKERRDRIKRLQIDADELVGEALAIATADPRELVEYVVGCCPFCWGKDNKRQHTPDSLARKRKAHDADQKAKAKLDKSHAPEPFDEEGGVGYDSERSPNPECPECHGQGRGNVVLKDTRTISEKARALYAGTEIGKDGIKVKMHSKLSAMDMLFRNLGLYEKDNEQQAARIPSSAELDDLYAKKMAERAEKQAKVSGRSDRFAKAAKSK